MIVIVPCSSCHGEGFVSIGLFSDGAERERLCSECRGACVLEEEHAPRTLLDLEQEDFDMMEASLDHKR